MFVGNMLVEQINKFDQECLQLDITLIDNNKIYCINIKIIFNGHGD